MTPNVNTFCRKTLNWGKKRGAVLRAHKKKDLVMAATAAMAASAATAATAATAAMAATVATQTVAAATAAREIFLRGDAQNLTLVKVIF